MASSILKILRQGKEDYEMLMAKIEIKKRTANLKSILQWNYILRTQIEIPWPSGMVPFLKDAGTTWSTPSSDPNTWYRDWLEEHVGTQGWHWDWRAGHFTDLERSTLIIKFRQAHDATNFLLMHG